MQQTYGMEDASSAIEAAMHMIKRHGMSHPKTIPTCPPDTSGKDSVDDTPPITAMMENANATVSISFAEGQQSAGAMVKEDQRRTENSRLNSLRYPSSASRASSAPVKLLKGASDSVAVFSSYMSLGPFMAS